MMTIEWSVRCDTVTQQGRGEDRADGWRAAIEAACNVAQLAIVAHAGRPVAELPAIALVVGGDLVQLRAGLDANGRLDRMATTAAATLLASAGS